jgi:hypothetical protein
MVVGNQGCIKNADDWNKNKDDQIKKVGDSRRYKGYERYKRYLRNRVEKFVAKETEDLGEMKMEGWES